MKRRNALAAALAFVTAGSVAFAQTAHPSDASQAGSGARAGKATARAQATIAGEGVTGTADIVEMAYDTGTEVEVTVTAKGLKPGLHGVHLHAVGKCEPPAFTAAGGHFDPGPAGNTDPDANHPYHLGDIPNLRVGSGRLGHAAGEDDARDVDRGTVVALRRRRLGHHHPREPGPGHHGRAEIGRERRTSRGVRRDREEVVTRRTGVSRGPTVPVCGHELAAWRVAGRSTSGVIADANSRVRGDRHHRQCPPSGKPAQVGREARPRLHAQGGGGMFQEEQVRPERDRAAQTHAQLAGRRRAWPPCDRAAPAPSPPPPPALRPGHAHRRQSDRSRA